MGFSVSAFVFYNSHFGRSVRCKKNRRLDIEIMSYLCKYNGTEIFGMKIRKKFLFWLIYREAIFDAAHAKTRFFLDIVNNGKGENDAI